MTDDAMESLIRRYFDACNAADANAIAACFVADAVHYFPPGMYGGPFRGVHPGATAARLNMFDGVWERQMCQ
jgi:hypothetical protein